MTPPLGSDREERFARFALVDWWDQQRLADARVIVVGAGALGNEVVKNLTLLGVGHVVIVDLDVIETSNLPRSVLFRPTDVGRAKAVAAALAAGDLFDGTRLTPFVGDVVHDVGLGLWRWADVVIGALDNREARLAVNRACYRTGTAWVDGAIEVLSGVARVFAPPGPCYECTMSDNDWRLLEQRRSCSLLVRQLAASGGVPTTPTTASVIAGVQVQEALKLLHGLPTLAGAGFVFDGMAHTSYKIEYTRDPGCMSHEPLGSVELLGCGAADLTGAELLARARERLGPEATLDLGRELLAALDCPACGTSEQVLRPMSAVTEADAVCTACGARRAPRLFHALRGDEPFVDRSLAELGVPAWDVITACAREERVAWELDGDQDTVLAGRESEAT